MALASAAGAGVVSATGAGVVAQQDRATATARLLTDVAIHFMACAPGGCGCTGASTLASPVAPFNANGHERAFARRPLSHRTNPRKPRAPESPSAPGAIIVVSP